MKGPFPTTRHSLHTYLSVAIPYLVANKTRLGISNAVINALLNKYGAVSTPDTYLYFFAKWADESQERTHNVISNLNTLEAQLKKMLTSIYEDIPASVWIDTDRLTLNRKRGGKHPYTRRTKAIESNTFLHHKIIGHGHVLVKCFAAKDSSRASIDRTSGANAIQMAMCIIAPDNTDMANEKSGLVKKETIKSVDECSFREIHLKATMHLTFDAQYRKCDVHIYARQYDVRHPELAGPWSVVLIVTIP
jgi:hypothetical protein